MNDCVCVQWIGMLSNTSLGCLVIQSMDNHPVRQALHHHTSNTEQALHPLVNPE